MKRQTFLRNSGLTLGGMLLFRGLFAKHNDPVYGYNGMTYRMDNKWGNLDPAKYPVKDCHEMVQDSKGRIILLTNETHNNILIYDKSGKFLSSWGHDFPGAHGLTLHKENGTDFLYITDTEKHEIYKTTIDGKLLMTIDYPAETGVYPEKKLYVPTETTVLDNGDIYVADGYGLQYIMHYDSKGKLKHFWGGKGDKTENFNNAHGITIDSRQPEPDLLITDRTKNCFKRFSFDGNLKEVIELPGACVCRPVIHGDHLYAAVLRSPNLDAVGTGFVTIIDKNNKVVSNLGGSKPEYKDGKLQPMSQTDKIFIHPHDVCVDDDHNLYVAQWDSGKVYPYKFNRV